MRVTQSMLSGNMLRNLSSSYAKMGKLQNQVDTGKKVTRPSDDPVVVMKGIGYRTEVSKVEQFQRNIGEVNSWLDISDDALDKVGSALQRVSELAIQGANDTLTDKDREKIKSELDQIRKHIQSVANSKVGDKYIFSGTKTTTPLYDSVNGYPQNTDPGYQGFINSVDIEIFDGVTLKANTNTVELFKNIDSMLSNIPSTGNTATDYNVVIGKADQQLNDLLVIRSDIGARQNRVELMDNRLQSQEIISTKRMSENEDINYEESITDLITQESVHSAALSIGARIIQPSLTDFLR